MIDKVYIAWFDNGEAYEDNWQNVEAVFATRVEAEAYLDSRYDRHEKKRWDYKLQAPVVDYVWETHVNNPPYVCKDGYVSCGSHCPKWEFWFEESDDQDDLPCEEYGKVYHNIKKDYCTWTIREFELGEPK